MASEGLKMEYPEQLNNFCNYMTHLNRSKLTIEQYQTDLSMFFQGVGKRDWYPSLDCTYFWGKYNRPYGLYPEIHTRDRWTEDNPDPNAFWPRTNSYLTTDTSGLLIKGTADRYLVDASYCRLKNLQIGYNIPKKVVNKIKIQGASIYLSAENLWTVSPLYKYTKDINVSNIGLSDVDLSSSRGDAYNYPMMSTFTLGLNITF